MSWRAWVLALHRPSRVDDEEVPFELGLIPWWHWRDWLSERYSARVERVGTSARWEW